MSLSSFFTSCFSSKSSSVGTPAVSSDHVPLSKITTISTRIQVYMMQRDETSILRSWILHYYRLFPHSSLTILDNGSKNPETLEILDTATLNGIRVISQYETQHDFDNKGDIIAKLSRAHIDGDNVPSMLLVTEPDELLYVIQDRCISSRRDLILAELFRHSTTSRSLSVTASVYSVNDGYMVDPRHPKTFLAVDPVEFIDSAYTRCRSVNNPNGETDLTRFVFLRILYPEDQRLDSIRYRFGSSFDPTLDNPSDKLPPSSVYLADRFNTPKTCGNNVSLVTEEDLYQKGCVWIDSLTPTTIISRFGTMEAWDPHRYLKQNKDVVRHAPGPLHHYLLYGYKEDRLTRYRND